MRGDFLCEALEHMETMEGKENNIRLKLEEFWASEVHHHTNVRFVLHSNLHELKWSFKEFYFAKIPLPERA